MSIMFVNFNNTKNQLRNYLKRVASKKISSIQDFCRKNELENFLVTNSSINYSYKNKEQDKSLLN